MSSVVVRNPEILSGTPVFVGTRVPVKNLTDCLEGGANIDEFLDDFPSVKREQVIAFLEDPIRVHKACSSVPSVQPQ
jgi:uncharacterized protein (DUF433 family)